MPIDETERQRRRTLVQAHMDAENARDLEAIMATFSADAQLLLNGVPVTTPDALRQFHVLGGMTAQPGALLGTRVLPEREHITDDEIVIEGRLAGQHVGPFFGMPPTNAMIELFYTAIYRFDTAGKLASECVTMNWGPLDAQWKPQS